MSTIDWGALCKSAEPKDSREVAYRFGTRVFYDPGYTAWPIGIGYWAIETGTVPPFTVGPLEDIVW